MKIFPFSRFAYLLLLAAQMRHVQFAFQPVVLHHDCYFWMQVHNSCRLLLGSP